MGCLRLRPNHITYLLIKLSGTLLGSSTSWHKVWEVAWGSTLVLKLVCVGEGEGVADKAVGHWDKPVLWAEGGGPMLHGEEGPACSISGDQKI